MTDLRIDPEEARKLKDAVYIDSRNQNAWADASTKLPGAIRIPADDLSDNLAAIPPGRPLVIYCT